MLLETALKEWAAVVAALENGEQTILLRKGGLIEQTSLERDELRAVLTGQSITFYVGYDPTADSLHIGSLLPLVTQVRLARAELKRRIASGAVSAAEVIRTCPAEADSWSVGDAGWNCTPTNQGWLGISTISGSSPSGDMPENRRPTRSSRSL